MITSPRQSNKLRPENADLERAQFDTQLLTEPLHDVAIATTPAPSRPRICSDALFSGSRVVLIEHAGETYSLRHTSKGKLILTK